MSNIIACYPGTFDPITLGHLDVIKRATRLFSKLIIAVAESTKKNTWFTTKERLSLIKESVKEVNLDLDKVEIVSFNSLLVDFCKKKNIKVIVRGIRVVSDMEHEFGMAFLNRKLAPYIETIFLMPDEKYAYVSSSAVREIAFYGGSLSCFVTKCVEKALREKVKEIRKKINILKE